MSLEEERARQSAASGSAPAAGTALDSVPEASGEAASASTATSDPLKDAQPIKTEDTSSDATAAVLAAAAASEGIEDVGMDEEGDEDDDLARALALSRGDDVEMDESAEMADEDDEDAEIARASEFSAEALSSKSITQSRSCSRLEYAGERREPEEGESEVIVIVQLYALYHSCSRARAYARARRHRTFRTFLHSTGPRVSLVGYD